MKPANKQDSQIYGRFARIVLGCVFLFTTIIFTSEVIKNRIQEHSFENISLLLLFISIPLSLSIKTILVGLGYIKPRYHNPFDYEEGEEEGNKEEEKKVD